MPSMVVFRGEVCWLDSAYATWVISDEIAQQNASILFQLIAVESASVGGKHRAALVPNRLFIFLPSSIDHSDSEWSQGISNGKRL